MVENLTQLLKQGRLGRLEIINLTVVPLRTTEHGGRSVPWCRIGEFELVGLRSLLELVGWIERIESSGGQADYVAELIAQRRLSDAVARIREMPFILTDLIPMIGGLDVPMAVRIGIGAVIEELEGDSALQYAIPPLAQLTTSVEPQVRADACHYLGLCGDSSVAHMIEALLDDDNGEVSEIASETLALLQRAE